MICNDRIIRTNDDIVLNSNKLSFDTIGKNLIYETLIVHYSVFKILKTFIELKCI